MPAAATTLVLPGNEAFGRGVADVLGGPLAAANVHAFPDGETRVRIDPDLDYRRTVVVCSLFRPNERILPLLFTSELLREHGAGTILLLAPYLGYMRQDVAFHRGEAVSARTFARLLDRYFDALVTVDPHLHRIPSLDLLFERPARAAAAAPAIAHWVKDRIEDPLFVGPDSESEQWVARLAGECGAPHVVMSKERHGDRDVEIAAPDLGGHDGRTPVIVDDIISSGATLIAAVEEVRAAGLPPPVCIGVHGLFPDECLARLAAAGAGQVVTCNTVPHPGNAIDVAPLAAAEARALLEALSGR
jgi:ribose-phosphate pyrophosphokinase